ncbi:hypothetical protein KDJ56_17900 [Brevibacillus composti]|uniref:Uncharacterized protein n=1 Tax=Brevibacillus composti TaxID=2796470 RepID=A0A7T5EJF3_9BACL|nr:hypothetical protein [Brevibacillus composti]QQE73747.1 hypothetical protein JD108_17960 [Brevibacillus composti]QUO40830.1 hypothetical protein KDJ56_17900 [Brevibacillus composti]
MVVKGDLGSINHYTDLGKSGDTISVYDLKKWELVKKIKTPTPADIALDGNHLLVTNFVNGTLSIIDTTDLEQKDQIMVGEWRA